MSVKTQTKTFFEMIKVEHSVFALPFAYLGLVFARETRWQIWAGVTLVMVSFRTMGMAANRLIDRKIDAANPRTAIRALPSGKLKSGFVWQAALLSFLVFEITTYQLNRLCFLLSPIPLLLAWLYPLAKRFTWLSHFVLGIILGIAPYGAWLASGAGFSWAPGFLTLGVVAWVAGFDMIYALQDREFDRSAGLYSFPARFGQPAALNAAAFLHALTLIAWTFAGRQAGSGILFYAGILAASVFLIREHWLVRSFSLKKIEEAFFTMNAWVGLTIFIASLMDRVVPVLINSDLLTRIR